MSSTRDCQFVRGSGLFRLWMAKSCMVKLAWVSFPMKTYTGLLVRL